MDFVGPRHERRAIKAPCLLSFVTSKRHLTDLPGAPGNSFLSSIFDNRQRDDKSDHITGANVSKYGDKYWPGANLLLLLALAYR